MPPNKTTLSPETSQFLSANLDHGQFADRTWKAPFTITVTDEDALQQKRDDAERQAKAVYTLNRDYPKRTIAFLRSSFEAARMRAAERDRHTGLAISNWTEEWREYLHTQEFLYDQLVTPDEGESKKTYGPPPPQDLLLRNAELAVTLLPDRISPDDFAPPALSLDLGPRPVLTLEERYGEFLKEAPYAVSLGTYRRLEAEGFSSEVLDALIGLVNRVYERGVVSNLVADVSRMNHGYIAQISGTTSTQSYDNAENVLDPEKAREFVRQEALRRGDLAPDQADLVSDLLSGMIEANLRHDEAASAEYRFRLSESITPPQYVYNLGQKIVGEGEPITQQTLLVFREIKAHIREAQLATEGDAIQAGIRAFSRGLGYALLVFLVLGTLYSFIQRYTPGFSASFTPASVLGVVLVMNVVLVKGAMRLAGMLGDELPLGPLAHLESFVYAAPFAFGAMVVCMLLGNKLAMYYATGITLITLILTFDPIASVLALVGSISAMSVLEGYVQRSSVYRAGLMVGGMNVIVALAVNLSKGQIVTGQLVAQSLLGLIGGGFGSALLAIIAMPLLEWTFQITSNFQLMELITTNHKLLKDLTIRAPGTYTHSMGVANLAEAACDAVGANSVLARVGAYFHDIGKMERPQFFVENQMGEENPHDRFSPEESARILKEHVSAGLRKAREHKLPPAIQDFIVTHHGTDLIQYFFIKARNQTKAGEEVDEARYRYDGPKPHTRETAIVAMADSVEAATRALKVYTEETIRERVQMVITNKINHGQLDNCELTFQELRTIYETFVRFLVTSYHSRIEYPRLDSRRPVSPGAPALAMQAQQAVGDSDLPPLPKRNRRISPKHPMAQITQLHEVRVPPSDSQTPSEPPAATDPAPETKPGSKSSPPRENFSLSPDFLERLVQQSKSEEIRKAEEAEAAKSEFPGDEA